MNAEDAVIWVNHDSKQALVMRHGSEPKAKGFGDPIGAAYSEWRGASDKARVLMMQELVIELAARGFDTCAVLKEFAKVDEFLALGSQSMMMARALTTALTGKALEPNTMSFEELLEQYG